MSGVMSDEAPAALDSVGESRPGAAAPGRGRRASAASWEDAFNEQVVAVEGGHLHWTGATGYRGTPVVAWRGQVEAGYRLAFGWHHGRDPEGNVRPTRDDPCCVAGGHLADRVIREGGAA